jgi:uncharacterized protein (DUF433 family)
MQAKVIQNARQLVEAGVAELQAAGWTEAQIVAQLPYLAAEAVKFLANKAAH